MLRRIAVLFAGSFAAALACGGRTGDLLPSAGGEEGAATGSGGAFVGTVPGKSPGVGNVPAANTGNAPPVGRPPVRGSGGTIGTAPPPPPPPLRGSGGVVGAVGGGAGFVSGGQPGALTCTPPSCNCPSCESNCACTLGGQITQFCVDQCSGAGGSAGGPPVVCSAPTGQVVRVCPPPTNLPFPSCCAPSAQCGVLINTTSPSSYPFQTGCLPLNAPGTPEPGCPDLGQLFMAGASSGVPGCCRSDGTCGIDLSSANLGCVQSLIGGKPIECPAIIDGGPGGGQPVDAAVE